MPGMTGLPDRLDMGKGRSPAIPKARQGNLLLRKWQWPRRRGVAELCLNRYCPDRWPTHWPVPVTDEQLTMKDCQEVHRPQTLGELLPRHPGYWPPEKLFHFRYVCKPAIGRLGPKLDGVLAVPG